MRILMCVALLAVAGCAHREQLRGTPQEMAAQVQRWVPLGTSLEDAQRIMEQHGFTCSQASSDCLVCDLRESSGFPFEVYSYHRARLTFYPSGGVSAVQMGTTFKGP